MFDHISTEVIYAALGVVAVLVFASLVVGILRISGKNVSKELSQRVNSWWLMAGIFLFAILINRNVSIAFFAFISFLAFKEYLSLIPTRRSDRRVLFLAYLCIPIQYYWISQEWYGMFIIFIPVYMFLLLPVRMVMIGDTKDFVRAEGTIHWGLMTTVFSISHVGYLLVLPALPEANFHAAGPGLVLFLVFLTQANDVCQYIFGKLFGRRAVIPKISPNKTVAGFLGGVVSTTAMAVGLAPLLTPMPMSIAWCAGLIIGIGGFIGDVCISALKRDLGVKDAGQLIPGHGGILDRVDSLTYTAPLFFHFIWYNYY